MTVDPDGKDGTFEERLAAARRQKGLDAPAGTPAKSGAGGMSMMGVGMRVGVEMLSALVVGMAIGWGLDRWLHTKPILLAVFALLGGAGGIANVWRMMAPHK